MNLARALSAAAIGASLLAGALLGPLSAQQPASHPLVTPAEYERWQTELTNWGRWGADDQLGALNLITPAKRRQAAGLVKDGVSVSLASTAATTKAAAVDTL